MALDYFYDKQLRRYWLQFCRIFEGFQYESGIGSSGNKSLRTFPVVLGSKNRQVGHILRNNSENTILSTPRISCQMIDIQQIANRRQIPNHVSSVSVVERDIDPLTNKYTGNIGRSYTVERYMAVPYEITMRADIWVSNEEQKMQFMEQVLVLFNPSIDLQTGENPIDWTSLTIVELDSINWSNRELPVGTEDDIEVSSLTFKMPIWLSPPAKVKRQNIIHQIITNIGLMNTENDLNNIGGEYQFSSNDYHTRIIVTPENYQVEVDGNEIYLRTSKGGEFNDDGSLPSWHELLVKYGPYRPGISQFHLKTNNDMDDHSTDIVGTFDFHPTEHNKLLWTIDLETLRPNSLPSINGIINLQGNYPGQNLPPATNGQRYLLTEPLSAMNEWTNCKADINDIIQFDGTSWRVVFDASVHTQEEYLVNNRNSKQLRWTGEQWVEAINGTYYQGYWRVFL